MMPRPTDMRVLGGLDIRRDCGRSGDRGEAPSAWLCPSPHSQLNKPKPYQEGGGGLGDQNQKASYHWRHGIAGADVGLDCDEGPAVVGQCHLSDSGISSFIVEVREGLLPSVVQVGKPKERHKPVRCCCPIVDVQTEIRRARNRRCDIPIENTTNLAPRSVPKTKREPAPGICQNIVVGEIDCLGQVEPPEASGIILR